MTQKGTGDVCIGVRLVTGGVQVQLLPSVHCEVSGRGRGENSKNSLGGSWLTENLSGRLSSEVSPAREMMPTWRFLPVNFAAKRTVNEALRQRDIRQLYTIINRAVFVFLLFFLSCGPSKFHSNNFWEFFRPGRNF